MAQLEFRMSDFVEKFFYLNGAPFSLDDYPFMRIIYNIDPPELVLHTSRQVSKSTTLANIMLAKSLIMPQVDPVFGGGFRNLYVSPTVEQVRVFSHDRVAPVIENSSIIRNHFVNSSMIQNVFHRRFANGSSIYFRYGGTTAERVRGLSTDQICFDETQDLPEDNITIIQQTQARSMYKHTIYAGTPKRTIGSLASRWDRSTQNEWVVFCIHCEKNQILDEHNIAEEGLICRYCQKELNPKNGSWVRMNPYSIRDKDTGEYLIEGFRISVLMFYKAPWVNWQQNVWIPYNEKPRALFYNEWLGIPYDAGVAPITEADIKACCTGGPMLKEHTSLTNSYMTFLGIDWGPINSENSRTVMAVLQRRGDVDYILHMKRFEGREADYNYLHQRIPNEFTKWNAALIGADHGFGEAANSEIRHRIFDPRRLIAFQHLGNQKQKAHWNENMQAYTLGRNYVMTELFERIKHKRIVFPQWEDFRSYAKDILAIVVDYDEDKSKFKYVNSNPDDSFHAILYGDLVSELYDRNISTL